METKAQTDKKNTVVSKKSDDVKKTTTTKKPTVAKKASTTKKPNTPKKTLAVKEPVKKPSTVKDKKDEGVSFPIEILENPNISPIFDIDFYREVFMNLRSQLDTLYENKDKSEEDLKAYDDAVYNITIETVSNASAQDFMSYCYKRGKYDFCLMNYDKFMKWSFLAAANGNAFALSKLQIFLTSPIDDILSEGEHSYLISFLDLTVDNYIIFLSKLVCEEIVKLLDISPESLAKMKEVYLEQNEESQRNFDNIKMQAGKIVLEQLKELSLQLKEYVENESQEEITSREEKREKAEKEKEREEKNKLEKEIEEKKSSEEENKEKPSKKRVSVKKFRW